MNMTMQSLPSLKEEAPSPPLDADGYVRHEKHYYEDGNVIFVAEKTLFRLYRGLLARHSEVMQNLFGLATDDITSQERIHGVPAITLTDSAVDFANLLDFLLTPGVPPYPPSPDFEVLVSVLRISSKYLFDSIRDGVLWHLRQTLPKSLEDFESDPGLTMFTDLRAAQVISIAREFNLPEFLPLALYAIATYQWQPFDIKAAEMVYAALPAEDVARTVVGRTRIYAEALKLAYTMHEHGLAPPNACQNPMPHSRICGRGKPSQLWMNPTEALEEFLRNPLRQLVIRDTCEFHCLCRPCAQAIKAKMVIDLNNLYAKLPDIFQLEPPPDEGLVPEDSVSNVGKP